MSTCKFCDAEIDWQERVPYNMDGSRHSCKKKENLPKPCKYECGSVLLWNDIESVYVDKNTMLTHTKERCQEAKLKLEQKNDHGNELEQSAQKTISPPFANLEQGYVDHTKGQKLKLKVLTDPTPEGLSHLYNSFGENHNIRFSQYHPQGSLYTIAVFFEEVPLKQ